MIDELKRDHSMFDLLFDSSDALLLDSYACTKNDLDQLRQLLGRLEMELLHRMEQRGATMISSDAYSAEAPWRYDYPPGCFVALKEVFSASELAQSYTPARRELVPEHFEDHPEAWNTTRVLSIAKKLGGQAQKIIEQQRQPKRASLKFTTNRVSTLPS